MTLRKRITHIKENALNEIQKAAKKGDTNSIIVNTKLIEKTVSLFKNLDRIEAAVEALEKIEVTDSELDLFGVRSHEVEEELNPRMRGEIRRKEFNEKLHSQGIKLTRKGPTLYETEGGGLVGIAYASERNPYHWFLGLHPKDYCALVMLCENERGDVLSFVLPEEFYDEYKHKFSSSKGQLKFNIHLRGETYRMNIPRGDQVILNEFLDNYDSLKT